jgi:hypothetical protein
VQAVSSGDGYELHFWDAWASGTPSPSYYLALPTETALLAPIAVEEDETTSWGTQDNHYDYIAIYHRSLRDVAPDAVTRLLDHRAAQGLRVAEVDVQDVYDEFSYGRVDPEAIRAFLTYAYHHWNQGEEPPRFVLLVGDGHYDFKGVTGTPLPNLIPPYLFDIDPWIGETAADNRFVSADGPDDYLPDMAIGRIPANTQADVAAVVAKILAYEDPAVTPDGDWQKQVYFVADDKDNSAGNFHALSDETRLNRLPLDYDDHTIYYRSDGSLDEPAEMMTAIKQAFNDGALLLQWFGHASRFRWGSVSGIWNLYEPANLAPHNRLPFTLAYSCWAGYFINLYANVQTLGETHVLQPGRGAVADLSPSGLHVGSALVTLNQGMAKAIFQDRIRTVGEAVNAGKRYYYANSASWHDVIDTSVLFGDPATRLRLPAVLQYLPLIAR